MYSPIIFHHRLPYPNTNPHSFLQAKMPSPRTAASRRRSRAKFAAAKKHPQTQTEETLTPHNEPVVLGPVTPQRSRPTIRSPVRDQQPIAWQGFAPRSLKKKDEFAFSPDPSPKSASSSVSPPLVLSSPVAVGSDNEDQPPTFTLEDAKKLDSDDRTRREILRALHGVETDKLIRRCDARHAHRNPNMIAELEKRKSGWKRPQPETFSRTPSAPTVRDNGPRRTGAALLEYRRNQKAEIITRQLTRRYDTKPHIIIDTTLADRTTTIIERQATERVWMAKQREQRQQNRQLSSTSRVSMTRSVSGVMYETYGSEGIVLSLAEMAAAEQERKHNEEVNWMCSQMESVLERLQQDRGVMEEDEVTAIPG